MTKRSVWLAAGAEALIAAGAMAVPVLANPPKPAPTASAPRNVIVFVVDGMGPQQIALGRALKDTWLHVDEIPWQATTTLDTRSLDGVTDSAACAT
jgi:alkaline phosphatase